jgi:uncharacterized repeat protein (TIGR03943 family)
MKNKITLILCTIFLLKLINTKELNLLIHPRYFWLVYVTVVILILLIFIPQKNHHHSKTTPLIYLLNVFFIIGSLVSLQALSAQASALQSTNQIINNSQYSRNKRLTNFTINTEERSLQDWVTMFSINPEPDKYEGQKIKVSGFYFIDSNGSPLIARYAVSCCVADGRIIGIPLSKTLNFSENTWIEVSGNIIGSESDGERYSQIKVSEQKIIPTPNDPYITN